MNEKSSSIDNETLSLSNPEPGIGISTAQSTIPASSMTEQVPNDTQRAVKRKLFLSMKRKKPLINSGENRGEVIWVHVGQAGTNIGEATWETFRRDHGLGLDFKMEAGYPSEALYNLDDAGHLTPRAILADTDGKHLDDMKNRHGGRLFKPYSFLSTMESSGSLFPVGLFSSLGPVVMDHYRRILEKCDFPTGSVIFYAFGGGTGSGLGTYIGTHLPRKMEQIHLGLTPNPKISAMPGGPVEAYNTGLMIYNTHPLVHCTLIAENDAMYRLSERKSLARSVSQCWINRLMSQVMGTLTSGWRFPSQGSIKFGDLSTNLVISPTMKYATMSFAPLNTRHSEYENFTDEEIIRSLFEPGCYLIRCDPRAGQIAACIICRGPGFGPLQVNKVLAELIDRQGIRFARWAPPGIKVGLTPYVPVEHFGWSPPRCAVLVTNTRAIRPTWGQVEWNFNTMLSKRAYLHWYLREGMEIEDFIGARETLAYVVDTYCHN